MKNINPTQTSAWQALQKHFDEMKDVTIADLFAKDAIVSLSSPRPSTI
jgi:glucose-6-phosphate isomerase